jgi:hypothetical protein
MTRMATSIERPARIDSWADLASWCGSDWTNGVQVDALEPLDSILVQTRNTTYEITILNPRTGRILIQGGRYFPTTTRARLGGSSLGGSFLKLLGIYAGFCMEIWHDDLAIVTTRVRSIRRAEPSRLQ